MRPLEGFAPIDYGVFWLTRDKSERTRAFVECARQAFDL